jgi:hypothetical protein
MKACKAMWCRKYISFSLGFISKKNVTVSDKPGESLYHGETIAGEM